MIGIVCTIILLVKFRKPSKSVQKIQTYDSNGKVTSESSSKIKYTEDDGCKNEYNKGVISKKTCIINQSSSIWLIVLIITIVLSIFVFVSLHGPVKKWHYDRAIRFSNPWHKTFIDYAHRLFIPDE